jgi:hypothetical protein
MIRTVRTTEEIDAALSKVGETAAHARAALRDLPDNPLAALTRLKFDPGGAHPLRMRPLNVVEQINQKFTYLVALRAARLLLEWHADAHGLQLAPGAHGPKGSLDIESLTPGLIGAETFAAVRPENNKKLRTDLAKLADRPEPHRYVFFMSPVFPDAERRPELETGGVQVWSTGMQM